MKDVEALYFRAENETRTRDPQLGKLMLYQLSYFRLLIYNVLSNFIFYLLHVILKVCEVLCDIF